jgi:hypothetical protein
MNDDLVLEKKKSRVFESEQVFKFLGESPSDDPTTLEAKAALCFGYFGCLRCDDLMKLEWKSVVLKTEGYWVGLFDRKTGVLDDEHNFLLPYNRATPSICPVTIVSEFKKVSGFDEGRVFRTLRKGKFVDAPKGIHKLRLIPRFIANFLELDSPEKYTGQCFRRTSATALADTGESRVNLKRHGGWKSDSVVEGYMHNSKKMRTEIACRLSNQSESNASVSLVPNKENLPPQPSNQQPMVFNFNNCSNVTFNFEPTGGLSVSSAQQSNSSGLSLTASQNIAGLPNPVLPGFL